MKKLLVALLFAGGAGVNVEAMDQRVRPYDFFGTRGSEQVRVKPESEVVHLSVEIVRKWEEMQQSMALMRSEVDSLRKELRAKDAEIADLKKELEDKRVKEERDQKALADFYVPFMDTLCAFKEKCYRDLEELERARSLIKQKEVTSAECEEEEKDE